MNIVEELMAEAHERDGEYREALSIYNQLNKDTEFINSLQISCGKGL